MGFAVLDKPPGWTSHDVVAKSRGILGTRKVGHSGTLDPMATGVLVLGVGRATKLLRYLSGLDKTYEALISLGAETDSLDADGEITQVHDMEAPTTTQVRVAAQKFVGEIEQVPPMVSAIKVDGRRLHQLAREGKEVERAARPVTIRRFDLEPTGDPMTYRALVECSSGTYVRVLASELGAALGGGAHLASLRRTAVGPFGIDVAEPLESPVLQPVEVITSILESVGVDEATTKDVKHGKVLERSRLSSEGDADGSPGEGPPGDGPWAVLDPHRDLLAVYESHRGNTVKPAMVYAIT